MNRTLGDKFNNEQFYRFWSATLQSRSSTREPFGVLFKQQTKCKQQQSQSDIFEEETSVFDEAYKDMGLDPSKSLTLKKKQSNRKFMKIRKIPRKERKNLHQTIFRFKGSYKGLWVCGPAIALRDVIKEINGITIQYFHEMRPLTTRFAGEKVGVLVDRPTDPKAEKPVYHEVALNVQIADDSTMGFYQSSLLPATKIN